jgi:hypothetical protein
MLRLASLSRIAACVLISSAALIATAVAAAAEDADAPAAPVPDPGSSGQASCIEQTGDYVSHGDAVTYVIGFTNKCYKRLKCKIYAYVVGARGPASGETTLVLGAKSSGDAAKKTYAMKVKSAGGVAQVSRECRVF